MDLVGLNVCLFESFTMQSRLALTRYVAQAGLLSTEIAFPQSTPSGEFIKSTQP